MMESHDYKLESRQNGILNGHGSSIISEHNQRPFSPPFMRQEDDLNPVASGQTSAMGSIMKVKKA